MSRTGLRYSSLGSLVLAIVASACGEAGGSFRVAVTTDPEWIVPSGGAGFDQIRAAVPMPDGGFVHTGNFQHTALFAAGHAGQVAVSGGVHPGHLARHRADGTVLFVATMEGPFQVTGWDVAVAPDGILVCGYFFREVVFGRGQPNETRFRGGPGNIFSPEGTMNGFFAKYSFDGEFMFARHLFSHGGNTAGNRVAVLPEGDYLFQGGFAGPPGTTAVLHPADPNPVVLTSSTSFVARYTPDGQLRYARALPGTLGYGMVVTPDGGFVVAGSFRGALTFGAGTVNETTIVVRPWSPGSNSQKVGTFLARYDEDAVFVSVVRLDGSGDVTPGAVLATPEGLWLCGEFAGTAEFGAGTAGIVTQTTEQERAGFLAVYDYDLSVRFARSHGMGSSGIASLSDGRCAWLAFETPSGAGRLYRCLMYEHTGVQVGERMIGAGEVFASGLGVLADGNLFAWGWYREPATLGASQLAMPYLGWDDMFVAKYRLR
jgi:hypothetical protein